MTTPRVWFVTGSSRGFGREFVTAALRAGDAVAATARRPEALDDLVKEHGDRVLPLALDVTDRPAVERAVAAAVERFDRLDVVVNNAGYPLLGAVEEVTEEQARAQMEVNFFGSLWVTKAVIPLLRAQGSGVIVQVSSLAGVSGSAGIALYNASKWAVEGMTEAVSQELRHFGVRCLILEPAGFRTGFEWGSLVTADQMPEYDRTLRTRRAMFSQGEKGLHRTADGDPALAAQALLRILDEPDPPLRLLLGERGVLVASERYAARLEEAGRWAEVSASADSPPPS